MKKQIITVASVLLLVAFIYGGIRGISKTNNSINLKNVQLEDSNAEIKQLQIQYKLLNDNLDIELHQKNVNQDRVEQLEQEKLDLENKTRELEIQLQAKLDREAQEATVASVAQSVASVVQPSVSAEGGCGDNSYANYIYMHESSCNQYAVNSIGACGIGQALPCSKMGCDLSDYACQNAWFSNYAVERYGSWENAYYFWVQNRWW